MTRSLQDVLATTPSAETAVLSPSASSAGGAAPDEKPFRLVKSFSLIAVVMIFAAVFILVTVISRQAEIIITKRVEDDTIKLMENLNHQMYENFLAKVSDSDGRSSLRKPQQQALLHQVITNTIYGFDLKRVVIYGPQGEVVYATDATPLLSPAQDMPAFEESIELFKVTPRIQYTLPRLFRLKRSWESDGLWPEGLPKPENQGLSTDDLRVTKFGADEENHLPNLYYYPIRVTPESEKTDPSGQALTGDEAEDDLTPQDNYLEYQRSQTVFRYDRGGYLLFNFLPQGDFVLRSYKAMEDFSSQRPGISGVLEVSRDLTPEYRQIARLQYIALGVAALLALSLTLVLRWVVSRGEAIITRRNLQQRALRHRLDQAERLAGLGSMVATVAHEIRNPLGIIHSTADVLNRYLATNPDQARLARAIVEEADRLSEVVTDFLDFARPPAPKLEPVLVEDILEEILAFLEITLTRAGVEVRTSFRQEITPIPGDTSMLHRAFLNILINAIQAMNEGGLITLRTRREDSSTPEEAGVMISFSDTGPGLSREAEENIFSPFYTTKAKGTGLGLVIVRNIVEAHGGKVELETGLDNPEEAIFEGAGPGLTVLIHLKGNSDYKPNV